MLDLCRLIFGIASDLLRSQVALEAEILVLRQQINVLRRANPKRLRFVSIDRLILGGVCRLFPKMYGALAIVRPETVIRWHRAGFRSYWRWKSKHRCGRPAATVEIRQLIRLAFFFGRQDHWHRLEMDRLNDCVRRGGQKAVDKVRSGDWFRLGASLTFELGPDS